jgi:hypothetical protein
MFVQNERAFRDQTLILEMQQNLRAVASMIVGDLRMAGQGVPIHAAAYEGEPSEAVEVFLAGTDENIARFRTGLGNGTAQSTGPTRFVAGESVAVLANRDGVQRISRLVGSGTGRHVFLSGHGANGWTWVRAEIVDFPGPETVQVVPRQLSTEGGSFETAPSVSLEEAVSYRLSADRILRGAARDFSIPTDPAFTELTLADGFSVLRFGYADDAGAAVDAGTLEARAAIRSVDVLLGAETTEAMADGHRRSQVIRLSVRPRNLELR